MAKVVIKMTDEEKEDLLYNADLSNIDPENMIKGIVFERIDLGNGNYDDILDKERKKDG